MWDRIVAYEERENSIKKSMDEAVAKCHEVEIKFSGGLTADDSKRVQMKNEALERELAEKNRVMQQYKRIADQASAVFSHNKGNSGEATPADCIPQITEMQLSTAKLEQSETKLSQAQNQVMELQVTCKALLSVVQKFTTSNWYRHAPIRQVLLGDGLSLSDEAKYEQDNSSSSISKIKFLIDSISSLQSKVSQHEDSLATLAYEKDLLETRLLHFEGSDILNTNSKHDDLLQQLTNVKSKLFELEQELRRSLHDKELLETKNNILAKCNKQLEQDIATVQLQCVKNHDAKYSALLGALITPDNANMEHQHILDVLQQVSSVVSCYTADLAHLSSRCISTQAHREYFRVSKQVLSLKGCVAEKDRTIMVLKQKLNSLKQENNSDLSIGSPNRELYQSSRLEEASRLIETKDKALFRMSRELAEAEEANDSLSEQLQHSSKQTELLKTDVSTLIKKSIRNGKELVCPKQKERRHAFRAKTMS